MAGYIILSYSYIFKYTTQRYSQHRLLFECIFTSVILVFIAFIARGILDYFLPGVTPAIIRFLQHIPLQKPDYLWTSVCIFLTSCLLVPATNFFIRKRYGKDIPIRWAIDKSGDEIEQLFKRSFTEGVLMQISLKNNKVYIGFCEVIPIPHKTNFLTLTPILSGYRNNETKKIIITTDYFEVVERYIATITDGNTRVKLNTDIIIKQDEILTANIYEQEIFDMFNKPGEVIDTQ